MFETIPKNGIKPDKRVGKCRLCGKNMENINGNRLDCDECIRKR